MSTKLDWPDDGHHVFVGGNWTRLPHDARIESVSPVDESVIGYVPAVTRDDLNAAVELIKPSLAEWRATSPAKRVKMLEKFGQAILEHEDEIIEIENMDAGLVTKSVRQDIHECVGRLEFYCGFASEIKGDTFSTDEGTLAFTLREPYGIVARITAFNHPFGFAVNAASPVLLAGNAVILKPSEHTSLATLALAEIARTIFPPGVFNVVTGYGSEVGAALAEHPDIPRIGFTGSVPTGRAICRGAAGHIKSVTLELGGKNPLIVGPNSDPSFAADMALTSMNFINAGQSCKSSSRLLIHSSLHDEVVDILSAKMSKLKVGDPRDETTDVAPVSNRAHYERVLEYLAIGHKEGATAVVGGGATEGFEKGFYVDPTLFTNVTQDMRIASEEIFGPVLVVIPWSEKSELESIMNATEYGLYARIVTPSFEEALDLVQKLEVGTVLVNTSNHSGIALPFGGYKESGQGKQTCIEEVLGYTREKAVAIRSL